MKLESGWLKIISVVVMDGTQGGSGSSPPFLTKTYEMVDDPLTDHIVSWSHTGGSFVVWNPPEFASELLPKYFKHNNFSSFVRQLNTYIDPDQWEFANDEFIKGQRHLLKNIHRRKPVHSHSTPPQGTSSSPLSPSEKKEYEDEIKKLKHETGSLRLQLLAYNQENQENEHKLSSLHERLQSIQLKQKKMMSFLAQLVEKPRISSLPVQYLESNSKKRRLLISTYLHGEANAEENENLEIQELINKLDSSLKFWADFVNDVKTSSQEQDGVGDHVSKLDHAGSSTVLLININQDSLVKSKASGIDVNAEPVGGGSGSGGGGGRDGGDGRASAPLVKTGANDVFWEQFLTETPGGGDTQEVQSERRDVTKPLWSTNNLDKITGKMGNLGPGKLDVR
ncbi:hypothetical protein M8C21_005789 [Ambrosia artemisiifolia]|uniref:Heat stress transcription factor n=1 Tax=Ambrosia artemisiifolia TaxID=4212 RepID=A0AAD5BVW3_AMBAR|nr:hypothetical protein M8C21_005789 [Ambrosia artemisiifolia]